MANTPGPSAPILDVKDPIAQSASLPAEDGDQPDRGQTNDSALPWHNDESHAPADEEEPEDQPTEAAFGLNTQYSQEQQSPMEDPDSEDSPPRDGGEPEYPKQHVNQPVPASAVAFDQGKSSAASSLEGQPTGTVDKSEDHSASSPPAHPPREIGRASCRERA